MDRIEEVTEPHVQITKAGTRILEMPDVENCLNEYARLQSVDFIEWALKSAHRLGVNKWGIGTWKVERELTTDELYTLFQKQQK